MNYFATATDEISPGRPRLGRLVRVSAGLAIALLLNGCASMESPMAWSRTEFRPDNIYFSRLNLPPSLQRVAVLPVACENSGSVTLDDCESLRQVLLDELGRTKKFEVVVVNPQTLRRRSGQSNWTGAEALPADFLRLLQGQYDCDAVLFCQLTAYHAYAPLTVGWRLKMVDAHTRQILWAADEIFDSSRRSVAVAAWSFQQKRQTGADEWAALNSPARFGQYAAASLLDTLPER